MHVSRTTPPPLALAGTYRREVAASLARIWENVFDWEHLPALHGDHFHAVELLDRNASGWRIRLVNQPGDVSRAQVLELKVDQPEHRYTVTTQEGPGAGSEIRVRLTPRAAHATGVAVEFHVPDVGHQRLAAIGRRYIATYTQLWDQDEGMMVARERFCARVRAASPRRPADAAPAVHLGTVAEVRARAPFVVDFAGEPVRLVELDGTLLAHAATCPHWGGPLDAAPVVAGCVRCPWHGYRFDVRSGRSADGRGLALAAAPRVILEQDAVVLRAAGDAHPDLTNPLPFV